MELDVTKSEYYKFKEDEIFKNRCAQWKIDEWQIDADFASPNQNS